MRTSTSHFAILALLATSAIGAPIANPGPNQHHSSDKALGRHHNAGGKHHGARESVDLRELGHKTANGNGKKPGNIDTNKPVDVHVHSTRKQHHKDGHHRGGSHHHGRAQGVLPDVKEHENPTTHGRAESRANTKGYQAETDAHVGSQPLDDIAKFGRPYEENKTHHKKGKVVIPGMLVGQTEAALAKHEKHRSHVPQSQGNAFTKPGETIKSDDENVKLGIHHTRKQQGESVEKVDVVDHHHDGPLNVNRPKVQTQSTGSTVVLNDPHDKHEGNTVNASEFKFGQPAEVGHKGPTEVNVHRAITVDLLPGTSGPGHDGVVSATQDNKGAHALETPGKDTTVGTVDTSSPKSNVKVQLPAPGGNTGSSASQGTSGDKQVKQAESAAAKSPAVGAPVKQAEAAGAKSAAGPTVANSGDLAADVEKVMHLAVPVKVTIGPDQHIAVSAPVVSQKASVPASSAAPSKSASASASASVSPMAAASSSAPQAHASASASASASAVPKPSQSASASAQPSPSASPYIQVTSNSNGDNGNAHEHQVQVQPDAQQNNGGNAQTPRPAQGSGSNPPAHTVPCDPQHDYKVGELVDLCAHADALSLLHDMQACPPDMQHDLHAALNEQVQNYVRLCVDAAAY